MSDLLGTTLAIYAWLIFMAGLGFLTLRDRRDLWPLAWAPFAIVAVGLVPVLVIAVAS